ncbi:MAG: hypothetical protein RLO52_37640 [Sandaracinaceae bacterium]
MSSLDLLADRLSLGDLLETLRAGWGEYELVAHWKQGEFHHDVVLRVEDPKSLPGRYLVVATNCNGGVKEVLSLDEAPDREALWHWRCPEGEFEARTLGPVLSSVRTCHWFDPCELLTVDARSELRPEHRRRQRGGGWEPAF